MALPANWVPPEQSFGPPDVPMNAPQGSRFGNANAEIIANIETDQMPHDEKEDMHPGALFFLVPSDDGQSKRALALPTVNRWLRGVNYDIDCASVIVTTVRVMGFKVTGDRRGPHQPLNSGLTQSAVVVAGGVQDVPNVFGAMHGDYCWLTLQHMPVKDLPDAEKVSKADVEAFARAGIVAGAVDPITRAPEHGAPGPSSARSGVDAADRLLELLRTGPRNPDSSMDGDLFMREEYAADAADRANASLDVGLAIAEPDADAEMAQARGFVYQFVPVATRDYEPPTGPTICHSTLIGVAQLKSRRRPGAGSARGREAKEIRRAKNLANIYALSGAKGGHLSALRRMETMAVLMKMHEGP